MINDVPVENCCGCGACLNICPKKAISMKKDELGNKYPYVDMNICIKCGLCKKICPYNNHHKERSDLDSYASISKDERILNKSSSGGVFGAIAYSFLEDNGLVCGCTMIYDKNEFVAKHIIIDSVSDLYKIQGSKYVQSDIVECLPEIKKFLNLGKKVLFSGTPCQVAGLKAYLQKDYSNLYTMDIICHGAPENKFLNDYIELVERKHKVKINEIVFRDKNNGWGLSGYLKGNYDKKRNKTFMKFFSNNECSYYYLFQKGFLYRPNCYKCPYASNLRPGDITIGDFWGIQNEHPEIEYKKGISCLILNDDKGTDLLQKYGKELKLYNSTFRQIQRNNTQLEHPTIEPELNRKLQDEYKKYGYEKVESEFRKIYGYRNLLKRKLKTRIKKIIKSRRRYRD